ncbi:hypothetical protein NQ176_g6487 [Zarea fungicola]|uniref:Uncharacterized protein n=1 Tax=Zarea fungicola TaxID=93591 RepID=A0ACC1N3T6_9HYPO|nr:hypothetical protein NQ176_g6487 [Lecanicillium fungicola]
MSRGRRRRVRCSPWVQWQPPQSAQDIKQDLAYVRGLYANVNARERLEEQKEGVDREQFKLEREKAELEIKLANVNQKLAKLAVEKAKLDREQAELKASFPRYDGNDSAMGGVAERAGEAAASDDDADMASNDESGTGHDEFDEIGRGQDP